MAGIWRILVVAAVGVAAFVAALISFEGAAEEGCVAEGRTDPSYQVELQGPARTDRAGYELTVERRGRPVTGARVCVLLDMGGEGRMSAMATGDEATELEPGVYRTDLRFAMGGHWQGQVLVIEEGRTRVSVDLELDVAAPGMEDMEGM